MDGEFLDSRKRIVSKWSRLSRMVTTETQRGFRRKLSAISYQLSAFSFWSGPSALDLAGARGTASGESSRLAKKRRISSIVQRHGAAQSQKRRSRRGKEHRRDCLQRGEERRSRNRPEERRFEHKPIESSAVTPPHSGSSPLRILGFCVCGPLYYQLCVSLRAAEILR